MHTTNVLAIVGVGFLAIGAIFSVSDLTLSCTSFELMAGPIFWIVGCALMVAWAIGRVGHATRHRADTSDAPPLTRKEEIPPHKPRATSEAAAAGCHRKAVTGRVVADFLAPLAMWLVVLWFLAAITLLLGGPP